MSSTPPIRLRDQWLHAPRLLELPLAVRAMWAVLAAYGEPVQLADLAVPMRLTPNEIGDTLAALIKADLVLMESHPTNPSFLALPALPASPAPPRERPLPTSFVMPEPDAPPSLLN